MLSMPIPIYGGKPSLDQLMKTTLDKSKNRSQ